jgi:microcystin degradation protein MlrC
MSPTTPRLLVAGILHETNTFAPPTTLDDFEVWRGDEIAEHFAGTRTFPGGMLAAAAELGFDVHLGTVALAQPAGTITTAAYTVLRAELLDALRAAQPDAVALALHGAAVAEGVDDVDGDLLTAVREVVGPAVPVVGTLDLHANLSQAMGDAADALFGDQEYPHVDMFERGQEAVRLLPKLLAGSLRCVAHVERLPMLLPPTTTFHGPLTEVNELCRQLEEIPGVVDVTFHHGFPMTDVPGAGASVLAITDNNPGLARRCAAQVAEMVWELRDVLLPESLSCEQAIARALAEPIGPVVINETSDNSGGGAPGDGTHLLRAMLDAGLRDACFGFVVDPLVAAQAHRAGVGATIDVELGARSDALHGTPIRAAAYVKSLSDGRFVDQAFAAGTAVDLGAMARLRIDGIDVVVSSRRSQTFDPEPFLLHGIDVRRCRVVALKSSQHFRAGFEGIARAIVTADPPGLTTLRVDALQRHRVARPVWPLDDDAAYAPALLQLSSR